MESKYPVVLYESPYRLKRTLLELSDIGLSRFECILIKEISKVYEQVVRMSIGDLTKKMEQEKNIKGEFVIVINKK